MPPLSPRPGPARRAVSEQVLSGRAPNLGAMERKSSSRSSKAARAEAAAAEGGALLDRAAADAAEANEVDATGRLLVGAGIRDVTRAEDVETVASRVGTLSA